MKSLQILLLALSLNARAFADTALVPQKESTQAKILQTQAGKTVELLLKSGGKIAGKVAFVGENVVHLTALTGMEMFEATVSLDSISAVLVRRVAK